MKENYNYTSVYLPQCRILKIDEYKDFNYAILLNSFGGKCSYIDVDKFQFLGNEDEYDTLPFHGGCTFSGTLETMNGTLLEGKWLIGCDWCHSASNMFGIENASIDTVEENIKYVIDSLYERIVMHDVQFGG